MPWSRKSPGASRSWPKNLRPSTLKITPTRFARRPTGSASRSASHFIPAGTDAVSYDIVPGSAVLVEDTGDEDETPRRGPGEEVGQSAAQDECGGSAPTAWNRSKSYCGRLKLRTVICARDRSSVCAWLCWGWPGSASPIRAAQTASVSSPMSKSIAAPRTPSRSSPDAGWASALSSSRLGQDGGDLCRSRIRPRHSNRGARKHARARGATLSAS